MEYQHLEWSIPHYTAEVRSLIWVSHTESPGLETSSGTFQDQKQEAVSEVEWPRHGLAPT